jgi:hypothetical protein
MGKNPENSTVAATLALQAAPAACPLRPGPGRMCRLRHRNGIREAESLELQMQIWAPFRDHLHGIYLKRTTSFEEKR